MLELSFLLVFLVFGLRAAADQTITVDGQDLSIKYTSTNATDTGATWITVQRSTADCDTPQRLTSKLGDTMTFTFTGTGVFVIGTIGPQRGLLNFDLDGTNSTYDRTNSVLMCDSVLFQKGNLPFQQHVVSATLIGRELDLQSGLQDGVLSVQRIQYTIPGSSSGSSKVPVIVGVAVGVVALLCAIGLGVFLRRRKAKKLRQQEGRGYFDTDDIPAIGKTENTTSLVATPFQWGGPSGDPQGQHQDYYNNNHDGNAYGANDEPGSPSLAASQPLLVSYELSRTAHANASPPAGTGLGLDAPGRVGGGPPRSPTHTSSGSAGGRNGGGSGSDPRRDPGATGRGAALVASNPDPSNVRARADKPGRYAMEPIAGGSRRPKPGPSAPSGGAEGGQTQDEHLVDRIAIRLADMLTERVGRDPGSDALPPSYDVADRSEGHGAPSDSRQTSTAALVPTFPPPPPPPVGAIRSSASSSPEMPGVPSSTSASTPTRFGPRPRPAVRSSSVSVPPVPKQEGEAPF